MVGYFCTSRKFGLRRSLSRISTRVSTDVASMVASRESFEGSEGSCLAEPLTFVNAPRTVDTPRCRTENCAEECMGSICHVPTCAAALATMANRVIRINDERDILG